MKYAHIYAAGGKKFTLTITATPAINVLVLSEHKFDSKAEAKKYAKELGAKPWNY